MHLRLRQVGQVQLAAADLPGGRAEALWPDCDWDASRKHTLSNVVTTPRSTLRAASSSGDIQPLVAARQRLQLSPSLFTVDLDAFDAAIRRTADLSVPDALGEYARALRLHAGEFLEGEFFTWRVGD